MEDREYLKTKAYESLNLGSDKGTNDTRWFLGGVLVTAVYYALTTSDPAEKNKGLILGGTAMITGIILSVNY